MIGTRVKRLREKMGITQQELADKADVTQATVSRIEAGHIAHSKVSVANRVAYVLGVTLDALASSNGNGNGIRLNDDSKNLVKSFNGLGKTERASLIRYAKFLSNS